jgi:hypothetical protein
LYVPLSVNKALLYLQVIKTKFLLAKGKFLLAKRNISKRPRGLNKTSKACFPRFSESLSVNKAKLYLLAYKKNFVFFIDKPLRKQANFVFPLLAKQAPKKTSKPCFPFASKASP